MTVPHHNDVTAYRGDGHGVALDLIFSLVLLRWSRVGGIDLPLEIVRLADHGLDELLQLYSGVFVSIRALADCKSLEEVSVLLCSTV